ncbi:MAG: sensor domain-containing diguanylate cyclase [Acidimicrobiales bacterium]
MARDERSSSAPRDLEEIRRALQAHAREFLLLVTPRGELVGSSTVLPETFGYDNADRIGHHVAEHLHPDDLPGVFDLIERARQTPGFEETIRVRARAGDGSWRRLEATVIDATHDPRLQGAVLRVRDVTDDGLGGPAHAPVGVDRFLSLAEALPLGILSADARGNVVFCNEAAQQIFNLPADHLMKRGWERAVHAEDRADVASAAGAVVRTGTPHQVTFRVETGLFVRWAHAKFVPLGEGLHRSGWIATIDDVTDRRRTESRLAHQATHDPLTGLPNRVLLDDRLHQAAGRLRRDTESVTILFVDLDRFKEVNDAMGHAAGDEVLVEVAHRLRTLVREVDTVARLGGDEFVIVCENLPVEEADGVVARIDAALAVPMLVRGATVTVGASVGVAHTTDAGVELTELLTVADQDMYRIKVERRHLA